MVRNVRTLIPLAVTASVGAVWVVLRLVVFGTFIFPLTYILPLLLVVWTRNTVLLWSMAGAFAALHTFQQFVRVPADALPGAAYWATYVATMLNILLGATAVRLIIRSRERQFAHEAQARHDAEEREYTLRTLLDHIPLGITIADAPDVRIRAVSRFGLGLTGRAAEELEGIPVDLHAERWRVFRSDGVTPATNDELPLTRATVHGETVRGEEWVLERPDGTRMPILCTAAPIRDAQGRLKGGVIGWQDISERKQVEEALSNADARYRALFNAIDEGFCIIEVLFDHDEKPVDYRFVETNPAFEKQTGLVQARGKRMRDLVPRHEQHWFEIYGRIALTGQPERFENRAEQLHRWYDVYALRIC
jgi:PAS domain S-box-containing protein